MSNDTFKEPKFKRGDRVIYHYNKEEREIWEPPSRFKVLGDGPCAYFYAWRKVQTEEARELIHYTPRQLFEASHHLKVEEAASAPKPNVKIKPMDTVTEAMGIPPKAAPGIVCPFANEVAKKIGQRAEQGLQKYGVTCERDDLVLSEWLNHLQEEMMDAAVYIEKTKHEIASLSEPFIPLINPQRQT